MPSLYSRQRPDLWKTAPDSRRGIRFRPGLGPRGASAWRRVLVLMIFVGVWIVYYWWVKK